VSDYRLPRLVKLGTPPPSPHPAAPQMPHRPPEQWVEHGPGQGKPAKRVRKAVPKPVVMPHHTAKTVHYAGQEVTYPSGSEERPARLVGSSRAVPTSPTDRRFLAIERLLDGIAAHVGYVPPPAPAAGQHQPSAVEQADAAMDAAVAFGRSGAVRMRRGLE
jgi:hypothetical protein